MRWLGYLLIFFALIITICSMFLTFVGVDVNFMNFQSLIIILILVVASRVEMIIESNKKEDSEVWKDVCLVLIKAIRENPKMIEQVNKNAIKNKRLGRKN